MGDDKLDVMSVMRRHEGIWAGDYIHVTPDGTVIDRHTAKVRCEFPQDGPYAYIQHNHFVWPDGRELKVDLPGVLKDDRLWWNTETFSGFAWATYDDIILLNLQRKDEPGPNFFEMITLGDTGRHRARTWQWFKDGRLFKRTLCNESRVA